MTVVPLPGVGGLPLLPAPRDARDVAAHVADAAAHGRRLRAVGRGTWLDAGAPVVADAALAVGALTGIVDYVPGDLTLTARAGTSLAEIARATAAERQFLALDPAGDEHGTLGATVATASAGPLAHAFGTPRDNVLGVVMVTGRGEIVRAGGRVVKNVAGFDLVRLATGAWGTVGVLTEVSVRLRALPEIDATVTVPLPAIGALGDFVDRLRALPIAPWALELVNASLAEQLGLGRRSRLLARLAGNAPVVAAQRAALATMGDVADAPPEVWRALRACEPGAALVARVSTRPSLLAALCREAFSPAAAAFGLLAHATPGRGVLRIVLPGDTGFGMPTLAHPDTPATIVVERAPAALRATLLPAARAATVLEQRVREAFDPARVLNPGIMG